MKVEIKMIELPTWAGKSKFSYSGSVKTGTHIKFGKGHTIKISPEEYATLLNTFSGKTVNIGTSRTDPPKGSLGEWFRQEYRRAAVMSYVGAILIHEGYAEKGERAEIIIHF